MLGRLADAVALATLIWVTLVVLLTFVAREVMHWIVGNKRWWRR